MPSVILIVSLFLFIILSQTRCIFSDSVFQRCLDLSLGLSMFSFHHVVNPIKPSDLHSCPAHLSLLLLRTPIMFVSLYNSSIYWFVLNWNYLRTFLFGQNILLSTFHSNVATLFSSHFVVVHAPQAYYAIGLTKTLYNNIFVLY